MEFLLRFVHALHLLDISGKPNSSLKYSSWLCLRFSHLADEQQEAQSFLTYKFPIPSILFTKSCIGIIAFLFLFSPKSEAPFLTLLHSILEGILVIDYINHVSFFFFFWGNFKRKESDKALRLQKSGKEDTSPPPKIKPLMETCSYPIPQPLPFQPSLTSSKPFLQFPLFSPKWKTQSHLPHLLPISATLNTPKGFGPSQKKAKKTKKPKKGYNFDDNDDDDEGEEDEEPEESVIPEIVTNRMMSRMAFSVGVPLFIGLLFFPFFYYLKVGLKIDVPTWIPFMVSFIFFGTALLGVSYGIVSSSWDPTREGSLLGWNEAKKNWPVFWQSIWGGSKKK